MKRGLASGPNLRRWLAVLVVGVWIAACSTTVDMTQSSSATGGLPDGGVDSGPLPACPLVPNPCTGGGGCVDLAPCPDTQVCCVLGCVPGYCASLNYPQGCDFAFGCVPPTQCQPGGAVSWMSCDAG